MSNNNNHNNNNNNHNNNNNNNNNMAYAFATQIVERAHLRRLARNTDNRANLEGPRPIIEARREPLLRMPTPVYVRSVPLYIRNGGMAVRVPARPAYNVDFE